VSDTTTGPVSPADSAAIELAELYRVADEDVATWTASSPYRCPSGCGICCTRHVPSITVPEAHLVARYLLQHARELPSPTGERDGCTACPFYNPDSDEHCTIYPVRPLICRLFGFAASGGRQDELRFKPCSHMPEGGSEPERGQELTLLKSRFGAVPPRMSTYGVKVVQIAASIDGASRESILPAVERELGRIMLARQYGEQAMFGGKPGPDSGQSDPDRRVS